MGTKYTNIKKAQQIPNIFLSFSKRPIDCIKFLHGENQNIECERMCNFST